MNDDELRHRNDEWLARQRAIKNYNPDQQPSFSKSFAEEVEPAVMRWTLQVKGVGCIVVRANRLTQVISMAVYNKADIGPCPDL